MLVGTRALVPALRKAPGLRFDVFPLPGLGRSSTVAEMAGYCISASTAHLAAAADFLAYASGPQASRIAARAGGVVPANLAALHSEAFTQPGRSPRHAQVFVSALRHADALPFSPQWPELEAVERPLVAQLFAGPGTRTDRLLARMERRATRVLAAQPGTGAS